VFLHGFGGSPVSTWNDFMGESREASWWADADMYFVGYHSLRREVAAMASYLRTWLASLPGLPGAEGWEPGNYDELVLVGHSLGGVIVRTMLLDEYRAGPGRAGSLLFTSGLATRARLFSPATGGFEPTGPLGVIQATGVWNTVQAILCGSPESA
jgi:hypothetical protein